MLNTKYRLSCPQRLLTRLPPLLNSPGRSCLHGLILLGSVLLSACGSSGGGNDGPPPVTNPNDQIGGPIEVYSETFQDSAETITKTLLDMQDFTGHLISTQVFDLLEYDDLWKNEVGSSKLPAGCVAMDRGEQNPDTSTGLIRMTFTDCHIHHDLPPRNLSWDQDHNMYRDITLNGQLDVDIHRTFDDQGMIQLQRLTVNLSNLYWDAWDGKVPPLTYADSCLNQVGSLATDANAAGKITAEEIDQLNSLLYFADSQIEADNADGGSRLAALQTRWENSDNALEQTAGKIIKNHLRKLHREHYKTNGTVLISSFGDEVESASSLLFLNQHSGITSESTDLNFKWKAKPLAGMPFNRSILRERGTFKAPSGKFTMKAINHYTVGGSGANDNSMFKLSGGNGSASLVLSANPNKTDLVAVMGVSTVEVVDGDDVNRAYTSVLPSWNLGDDHRQNHCRPQFSVGAASSSKLKDGQEPPRLYTPVSILMNYLSDPDYNFYSVKWQLSILPPSANRTTDVVGAGWTNAGMSMRIYHYGDYQIQADVSDGLYTTSQFKDFYISMREPTFRVTPPTQVSDGEPVSFSVQVDEDYEGTLSYTLLAAPDGVVIDEKGKVSWMAASPFFGENSTVNLIVAVSNEDATVSQTVSLNLEGLQHKPNIIPHLSNRNGRSASALLDLDDDGRQEWITSNNGNFLHAYQLDNAQLKHVWTYAYSLLEDAETIKGVQTIHTTDGPRLAVLTDRHLKIIDPFKAKALYSITLIGHVEADSWNRFAAADLDGDGFDELVVQINQSGNDAVSGQQIFIYTQELKERYRFAEGYYQRFMIGNVDTDPQLEIITQNGRVIDGINYQIQNRLSAGLAGHLALLDHDGDGIDEIGDITSLTLTLYSANMSSEGFDPAGSITLNQAVGQSDLFFFSDIDNDQIDEFVWAASNSSAASLASLSSDGLRYEVLQTQVSDLGSTTANVMPLSENGSLYLSSLISNSQNQPILAAIDINSGVSLDNANDQQLNAGCWPVRDNFTDRSFALCNLYSPSSSTGKAVGVMETYMSGSSQSIRFSSARFKSNPASAYGQPAFVNAYNTGSDSAELFVHAYQNDNKPQLLDYDFASGTSYFYEIQTTDNGLTTPVGLYDANGDGYMNLVGTYYDKTAKTISLVVLNSDGSELDKKVVMTNIPLSTYYNPDLVTVRDTAIAQLGLTSEIALLIEQKDNHRLELWGYQSGRLELKRFKILPVNPAALLFDGFDGDGQQDIAISYTLGATAGSIQVLDKDLNVKGSFFTSGRVSAMSVQKLSNGRTHLLLGIARAKIINKQAVGTEYVVNAIDVVHSLDSGKSQIAWQTAPLSGGEVRQIKIVKNASGQDYLHVTTHNAVYVTQ